MTSRIQPESQLKFNSSSVWSGNSTQSSLSQESFLILTSLISLPLSPGTGNSVKMVKESSVKMSRLPGPNMFSSSNTGYKAMARSDSGRLQREEQVQEIIELKKALAKTRQDLQKTRSRRESQDNRSSSDEVSDWWLRHLVIFPLYPVWSLH